MILPPITHKQKQILFLLYKFRYLTVSQLLILLHHKDPKRIKEWLHDLYDKKYINRIKDLKDVTKPIIYCLAQKAKHVLRQDEDYDQTFLGRLYKEKDKTPKFINHHLFLVDVYLFFLRQKEENTELHFFTQNDLLGYDYFPEDIPDAYITMTANEETNRYFLVLFDEYTPAWVLRQRVTRFLTYAENGEWQANTDNSPFPTILFICPNTSLQKHIYLYTKAKLEKSFNDNFSLFLTTLDKIKSSNIKYNDIWQKAE